MSDLEVFGSGTWNAKLGCYEMVNGPAGEIALERRECDMPWLC